MIKICAYPLCNIEFHTERSVVNYCSRACSNKDRQRIQMQDVKEWQVISCGGGVQSAGMIACVITGKLPKPDMVVMVDTGYEKQSTMDYVHDVLIPACNRIELEFNIIKTKDNAIFNKELILIPAYKRLEDGQTGKFRTRCNNGWKQVAIKRYLRSQDIKKGYSWIGISIDEAKRQRESQQDWLSNRYPLIEIGMSRYDCLYLVRSLGWDDPPKTACIMCPANHDDEWELMKQQYPTDWQRCLEIDNDIEKHNDNIYLHKSLRRLRDIIWRCDVQK